MWQVARLGWLVLASVCAGCVAGTGSARFPVEKIPLPEGSEIYAAEPRPDGVVGGPGAEKIEADVLEVLRPRGEKPVADGALAGTACWALREVNEGRKLDLIAGDLASRQFGFGGVLVTSAVFDMNARDSWHAQVKTIPSNISLARYGVCVSPSGRSGAVAIGSMEATYTAIPRSLDPGQSVTLKGELASRFRYAMLFLTKPDGKVDHVDMQGRAFDRTFVLAEPGSYRLEVMGNGPHGPVIAVNLPLYVGVPEPVARAGSGKVVDPDEAEPRLLELLNQARAKAGSPAVRADDELRDIARAHSEDMVDHHFFAHVSPSTGAPEERAQRAKVLVSAFGENIGLGATPEEIHEGLMSSPGHRMNMLKPEYTHVGIAAETSDSGLIVTMNFGRRPNPADVPTTTAQVEAWIRDTRSQRGLKPYQPDPVYRAGAQAGADALASGGDAKEVAEALQSGLAREVNRLRTSRPDGCTSHLELLELAQLSTITALVSPDLGRLGLGTRVHQDQKGKRLSMVIVLDGPACPRQ
jgi:uncharacterized protein YkwD